RWAPPAPLSRKERSRVRATGLEGACSARLREGQQDRLLHVQAIFRLLEDFLGAFLKERSRDLLVAIGGQAVLHDGPGTGQTNETFVDLVGGEHLEPLRRLGLAS